MCEARQSHALSLAQGESLTVPASALVARIMEKTPSHSFGVRGHKLRVGKNHYLECLQFQFLMWLEAISLLPIPCIPLSHGWYLLVYEMIPESIPPLLISHTPLLSHGWHYLIYDTILESMLPLPIPYTPPLTSLAIPS